MGEVWLDEPMRHGLAQHAAPLTLIETSLCVKFRAFAGDDQHMAIAFALRRFEKTPERRMRVPLPHAVKVDPGLDREMPAPAAKPLRVAPGQSAVTLTPVPLSSSASATDREST